MSLGAVARGCGKRVKGGIYAETQMSENGRPIEDFLVDPPAKIDALALGLSDVGVKLVQTNGVWNVLDVVGQDSYPNVADFVEEVRRFGLSRRLPRSLDFGKLTSSSRIILLHRRAFIENFELYYATLDGWNCPKQIDAHAASKPSAVPYGWPDQMCAGLWWQDVETKEVIEDDRDVYRQMPSFDYHARRRPDGVTPAYSLAIFATFPIHNIAVIRDADGGSDEEAMQAATRAALPVNLEDE